jgi:hypothetical protein
MSDVFACYQIGDTEEQVRAAFEQRYGIKPARVEKVIKAQWRGKAWGYWSLGPVPDKVEADYGEMCKP